MKVRGSRAGRRSGIDSKGSELVSKLHQLAGTGPYEVENSSQQTQDEESGVFFSLATGIEVRLHPAVCGSSRHQNRENSLSSLDQTDQQIFLANN